MNFEGTDQPLVTIAIATHNGASSIGEVLRGVLGIRYTNLQVLIGDDNSSDRTEEICRSYEKEIPQLNFIHSDKRLGINANYNRLLTLAEGRYFVLFDQDDERDPSFIPKCVERLERQKDAVLCHSHTGVKWNRKLYHINSLNSLISRRTVFSRIFRVLRAPSDINIYGLVRTDCLRAAGGWKPGLANTHRLLFSLALQGPFLQIPETLFWYTAKGLKFRPTNLEEIQRSEPDANKKRARGAGIRLAVGQFREICSSKFSIPSRVLLTAILFLNFFTVNTTKILYRSVWKILDERTPHILTRLCSRIVYPDDDIKYIIAREKDTEYYPKEWPLRNIRKSNLAMPSSDIESKNG